MHPLVNFVPWRRQRRQTCTRFWSVLFSASTVTALTIVLTGYATQSVYARVNTVLSQAERQLATSLAAAKPRLVERQQKIQQRLQQKRQREQTRRWQPELENLAQNLPTQAWLTQVDYQQGTLALTGKTHTFAALSAFESALRDSQAFRINQTGAIEQDAQGRWQFQYQLKWRESHERSL